MCFLLKHAAHTHTHAHPNTPTHALHSHTAIILYAPQPRRIYRSSRVSAFLRDPRRMRRRKKRIMYKPPRPEDFSVPLSLSLSICLTIFSFLFRSVCRETRSALPGQHAAVQLSRGLTGKERVVPSTFAERGVQKKTHYTNFTRKIFAFREPRCVQTYSEVVEVQNRLLAECFKLYIFMYYTI